MAQRAKTKSFDARSAYTDFIESKITLHDFAILPGNNAWERAVEEVQKVFPGTEEWELNCSDSEGGRGRWVLYGGRSYYEGAEDDYIVGGHLQFKYPTFVGAFWHAVADITKRGYKIDRKELLQGNDKSNVLAWRSALGQALAGGWAITHGMRSHWSGAGCQ